MHNEHRISKLVYAAKGDIQKADELIRTYIPFIKAEASKSISRLCTEQDDEYSIALMAFHEAILGYERLRGSFLNYAAMLIRSRIIDYHRREAKHQGHLSLHAENGEDERTILETLADERDHFQELANLEATKQELAELSATMTDFGVNFSDMADNSPKQERTLSACAKAIRYATNHPSILEELLRTRKLPMTQLVQGSGVERKTLERHRKYILAMLVIQTNGYEIVRGHLRHVLKEKGEVQV